MALNFGEQLTALMKKHRLSIAQMMAHTGGKSKTDVVRVMREETSERKRRDYLEKLRSEAVFEEGELGLLERALEVSRLGKETYEAQQAVQMLFRTVGGSREEGTAVRLDDGRELGELVNEWAQAERLRIVCFNCNQPSLFVELRRLFDRPDVEMLHLVDSKSAHSNPAEILACVAPVLCDRRYALYAPNRMLNETTRKAAVSELMIVRQQNGDAVREDVLTFPAGDVGFALRSEQDVRLYEYALGVAQAMLPCMVCLKQATQSGYDELLVRGYELEKNRGIYQFKPDFCLEHIPTELLLRAIRDSGQPLPVEERQMARLIELEDARFRNAFGKKQPTFLLMSLEGLRRFMYTGRISDHFFAMRAFLPDERREILGHLIRQAEENPFFHIALIRDERIFHRFTTCYICYDRLGVQVIPTNENYQSEQGYSDFFLNNPIFAGQFKTYFLQTLYERKAFGEGESLEMLKALM